MITIRKWSKARGLNNGQNKHRPLNGTEVLAYFWGLCAYECVCCMCTQWTLSIGCVGEEPQGAEASSAQILQFSPHAEKCMIKAQLTCLKSPAEREEEMAPYAAPCGHSIQKVWHRWLSGPASWPVDSNRQDAQTMTNTCLSRVQELKSHTAQHTRVYNVYFYMSVMFEAFNYAVSQDMHQTWIQCSVRYIHWVKDGSPWAAW